MEVGQSYPIAQDIFIYTTTKLQIQLKSTAIHLLVTKFMSFHSFKIALKEFLMKECYE